VQSVDAKWIVNSRAEVTEKEWRLSLIDGGPGNFSWLLKGKLAGCARPKDDSELSWLWSHGIRAIVCLNKENPLIREMIEDRGFQYEFIPVRDFSAPSIYDMEKYVKFVTNMINNGKPVVTCCGAGIGRTGTMLAVYLVNEGHTPKRALEEVKHKRRHNVEVEEQKLSVQKYARYLKDINR